jgi:hypothetical protein
MYNASVVVGYSVFQRRIFFEIFQNVLGVVNRSRSIGSWSLAFVHCPVQPRVVRSATLLKKSFGTATAEHCTNDCGKAGDAALT